MRGALLVAVVLAVGAGCGAHSTSGPAWPKATAQETDGGESIAPHEGAKAIAAAVEDEAKPAEKATATADKPAEKTTPAADKPADKPASEKPEDPLTTEEIIIEIED